MRQVKDGLGDLFEPGETQFIQHQGQDNGHRETDHQVQQIEDDGVFQRPEKVLVPENLGKGFHADPFAAVIALGGFIVVKNHPQAGIGAVVEQDHQDDRYQQQQIKMPVPAPMSLR